MPCVIMVGSVVAIIIIGGGDVVTSSALFVQGVCSCTLVEVLLYTESVFGRAIAGFPKTDTVCRNYPFKARSKHVSNTAYIWHFRPIRQFDVM